MPFGSRHPDRDPAAQQTENQHKKIEANKRGDKSFDRAVPDPATVDRTATNDEHPPEH